MQRHGHKAITGAGAGAGDQEIPERDVAMSAYCDGMDIAISEDDHTGHHGEAVGKWNLTS